MNQEPIPLNDLVLTGRSVIFVPTKAYALGAADAIKAKGVPVMLHSGVPVDTVLAWNFGDAYRPNGVLIVVTPMLAHGVRLLANRVIWVGRVPHEDSQLYGMYEQAMARCDRTLHPATRHHFDINYGEQA